MAERKEGSFNSNYFPGFFETFWYEIATISTVGYGDFVPRTWLGRILGTVVIFTGYTIFILLIAEISSLLTLHNSQKEIKSKDDLFGKIVATEKNSTSVKILNSLNAKVVSVKNIEKAYKKLEQGIVDAVVFDAPVLLYFIQTNKEKQFEIVGDIFAIQTYGIGLPMRSELRELINQALLKLKENGFYDSLYRKWFGNNVILK